MMTFVHDSSSAKVAPNWHLFQAEVLLRAAVVALLREDLARLPRRLKRKRKKRRRRSLTTTWDSGFSTKLLMDKTNWPMVKLQQYSRRISHHINIKAVVKAVLVAE
jgi:hypothetical protein